MVLISIATHLCKMKELPAIAEHQCIYAGESRHMFVPVQADRKLARRNELHTKGCMC
jgi:hypothetical protein